MLPRSLRRLFGPSRKELHAEIDRLMGLLADPKALELTVNDHVAEITVNHWGGRILGAACYDLFGDAKNWSSFEMGPFGTEKDRLLCIIQRVGPGADTPVETVGKLRDTVRNLLVVLEDYQSLPTLEIWKAVHEAEALL